MAAGVLCHRTDARPPCAHQLFTFSNHATSADNGPDGPFNTAKDEWMTLVHQGLKGTQILIKETQADALCAQLKAQGWRGSRSNSTAFFASAEVPTSILFVLRACQDAGITNVMVQSLTGAKFPMKDATGVIR